jgi:hypothetical protein
VTKAGQFARPMPSYIGNGLKTTAVDLVAMATGYLVAAVDRHHFASMLSALCGQGLAISLRSANGMDQLLPHLS